MTVVLVINTVPVVRFVPGRMSSTAVSHWTTETGCVCVCAGRQTTFPMKMSTTTMTTRALTIRLNGNSDETGPRSASTSSNTSNERLNEPITRTSTPAKILRGVPASLRPGYRSETRWRLLPILWSHTYIHTCTYVRVYRYMAARSWIRQTCTQLTYTNIKHIEN